MYKSTIRTIPQEQFNDSATSEKIKYWTLRLQNPTTLPSTSSPTSGRTLDTLGLASGYSPEPDSRPGTIAAQVDRFPQTYRNDPSFGTVISRMSLIRPDNMHDIASAMHEIYSTYQKF